VLGVQVAICDEDNYLTCTGCETTERATQLDCFTNEAPDGCCRVLLFSLNGHLIQEGTGPIFTVQYTVSEEAPVGESRGLNPERVVVLDEFRHDLTNTLLFPGEFYFKPDVTIKPEDIFYNPDEEGSVTVKKPICLDNPDDLVGGLQFNLCEYDPEGNPLDCMECIDCELTERTTMFDCVVLELPNGCCKVILFCKNPGCAINPGLCDIVTVVYKTFPLSPECPGTDCITQIPENIVVSDYDGFQLNAAGLQGEVCPFICGDVCPPDNPLVDGWNCGDGVVDIYDIMCEVDFALTAGSPDACQAMRADVPTGTPPTCSNPDGSIDILDIMVLIDMALNRQDCCTFYYTGVIY
jgi:hypothetical protein